MSNYNLLKNSRLYHFPKYYSQRAVLFFIISVFFCSIIFHNNTLPLLWMIFALIEVVAFFYFLNYLSYNWKYLTEKAFKHRLFSVSLIIRLAWVFFSYFFFQYHTGQPFSFGAADSLMYHEAGKNAVLQGFNNLQSAFWGLGVSDQGYPFFLAICYYLFGDLVLVPRVIGAILSSWTVILIYNIGTRAFTSKVGRIAGLMAMLLPNFIYYTGLHLKETLMVFLLLLFFEKADYLLHYNKKVLTNVIIIALTGTVLFFFRTVLALSAFFALFSALMLTKKQKVNWINRAILSGWFIIIIWFFLSARIRGEISFYFEGQSNIQEQNMQFRSIKQDGNALAVYGSTAVFLPFMFVAPFPTFINIETQQQQMLLSGGYFIRNIYAFFIILALILVFKRKLLRKHILLLSFTFAYLFILAKSSFAISERFHMPVVPFLLIFAALGVFQVNSRNKKYFLAYAFTIIIIIIGWNWFKLAGRGAI